MSALAGRLLGLAGGEGALARRLRAGDITARSGLGGPAGSREKAGGGAEADQKKRTIHGSSVIM